MKLCLMIRNIVKPNTIKYYRPTRSCLITKINRIVDKIARFLKKKSAFCVVSKLFVFFYRIGTYIWQGSYRTSWVLANIAINFEYLDQGINFDSFKNWVSFLYVYYISNSTHGVNCSAWPAASGWRPALCAEPGARTAPAA